MRVSFILALIAFLSLPFMVFASETPVPGEELFNSTSLGNNGKSCSACHPQGKGLEQIGDYDDEILQEFVNFCIRDAMKGKMLPEGAQELRAIGSYIRRFQKPN